MTVARTTLLDLPIITTGTESGLWGDYTNNGLTQYLDISIAGMSNLTSANFTAGALTIETTEGTNSATNIVATSAQYAGFRVSSLATDSTITVGNTGTTLGRSYRLINADSTYTLTFKATGQTGITLQPGQSAVVAFNGTDYALVGAIGPTVPVARGGTGATTLTANNVILGNGTSAVQFVAPGTTGNVLTSNGTTWTSAAGASLATPLAVVGNATAGSEIRLPEDTDNGNNYVALKAADSIASNVTFTLPSADGTSGQVLQTNGSGALSFTTPAGGFSTAQVFTSSGNFTSPASGKFKVTIVGGGGGGATGNNYAGGGGGGGGTVIKWYSGVAASTSCTVTIGSAGSGGSSATAGGNSSFSGSGISTLTASGGSASGTQQTTTVSGGAASGGDVNVKGGNGSAGQNPGINSGAVVGGFGGGSLCGLGGAPGRGNSAGSAATGYGGGGGGGGIDNGGATGAGGAGTGGICIVEY